MAGWLARNGLMGVGLVLSVGVHLALFAGLRNAPKPMPKPEIIEMTVVKKEPPPPPPPEKKPEPPKPEPPKPKVDLSKVRPVKRLPPPPPNTKAPPPPTNQPPPQPVAGLTKDSFSNEAGPGSPTFGAGNTLFGEPPKQPPKPEEVRPYQGPVDLADVTTEPVAISRPSVTAADYPGDAKAQAIEGLVKVRLEIDENGRVTRVKAYKGPPLLHRAAEDLVRQFRYKPATQNGKPVAVKGWIEEVSFRITD